MYQFVFRGSASDINALTAPLAVGTKQPAVWRLPVCVCGPIGSLYVLVSQEESLPVGLCLPPSCIIARWQPFTDKDGLP